MLPSQDHSSAGSSVLQDPPEIRGPTRQDIPGVLVLVDVAERLACFKLYPCFLASNVEPHEEAEFGLTSRSKRCSYPFLAKGPDLLACHNLSALP